MLKRIATFVLSTLAGCLILPVTVFAADEYDVMGFDGKVTTVTEPVMTTIIENIVATDGQEVADLYLEAVKTGDYSKFYEVTKDTTETGRRESYVTIDGEVQTDSFLTTAQTAETWAQTIAGPEFTIPEVGKMIEAAGYEASNDGAQEYFMAILFGEAQRPSNVNPVYRFSEIKLETKTMEDIEWLNKGVIVEYEDIPLTTFQRDLAKQYGMEIKSAKEVYGKEEKVEDQPQTQTTEPTITKPEVKEETPVQAQSQDTVNGMSVKTFSLIAMLVCLFSIVITVVVLKAKNLKNTMKNNKR